MTMTTTTGVTNVLRKARAATLLARVRERGTLRVNTALLTAWAASGWKHDQIITAAHDLVSVGIVRLTTTPNEIYIIAMRGGAE